jgi:hypothetical protein
MRRPAIFDCTPIIAHSHIIPAAGPTLKADEGALFAHKLLTDGAPAAAACLWRSVGDAAHSLERGPGKSRPARLRRRPQKVLAFFYPEVHYMFHE